MPMTFTPAVIAKWEQGQHPSEMISLVAFVHLDSGQLRLVDPERHDYKIDVVDPRFTDPDVIAAWPIKDTIQCGMLVDIEWILSTVRVCRVHQLSVSFPIETPNGLACFWPPSGPVSRFDSSEE